MIFIYNANELNNFILVSEGEKQCLFSAYHAEMVKGTPDALMWIEISQSLNNAGIFVSFFLIFRTVFFIVFFCVNNKIN